jgi:hypothetical protein
MRTKDQIALEEAYNSVLLEKKNKKKPCCDKCKNKKKNSCCGAYVPLNSETEEMVESFLQEDFSVGPEFIEAMSYWVTSLGAAAGAAGAYNASKIISKYKDKRNVELLLKNPEITPLYKELTDLAQKYKETKDVKYNFQHQNKANQIKEKIAELIGIEATGEDASKYHSAVKDALQKNKEKTI